MLHCLHRQHDLCDHKCMPAFWSMSSHSSSLLGARGSAGHNQSDCRIQTFQQLCRSTKPQLLREHLQALQLEMMKSDVSCDNVCGTITDLCANLSTTYSGRAVELGTCTFTAPKKPSDGADKWAKTPVWLGRAGSLFCFAINPDTFAVTAKPLSSYTLCIVSKGPKLITRGKLEVGDQAAIIFDSSCGHVRMSKTVIRGGTIVCHGGCSVRFDRVKFEGCSLLVLGGAKVLVKDCSFMQGKADKVAVCSTGEGSTLRMLRCEVAYGWDIAVLCKGAKASAELRECTIAGAIKGTVAVVEGACGTLSKCGLHECSMASSVKIQGKGSIATLTNCHIEGAKGSCVEVIQAGKAVLTDCNMYKAQGSGALAFGVGSRLEMDECYVATVQNSGVELLFGAQAVLKDCAIHCVTAGPGVRAQGMGATLRMLNSTVEDTHESSVDLDSFSNAELRECRLEKSISGSGAKVSGKYAHAEINQCCVDDVEHSCVEVSYGSQSRVNGCLLKGSRAGAGLAVRGSKGIGMLIAPEAYDATVEERAGLVETKVMLQRSILENNAVHGVVAVEGGRVKRVQRSARLSSQSFGRLKTEERVTKWDRSRHMQREYVILL